MCKNASAVQSLLSLMFETVALVCIDTSVGNIDDLIIFIYSTFLELKVALQWSKMNKNLKK